MEPHLVSETVIDGTGCHVYDTGPQGSEEAVVFVHGNPGPMDDWSALVPAVRDFGRVLALDLPGFGRADRPRDFDYSIAGYARYLGAVLDQRGIRRAHLVLHDFGGPWGLRWMLDHPDRVASLTCINTGVLTDYAWHGFARVWQLPLLGELFQLSTTRAGLRFFMNRDNPRPLPASFIDRIAGYADWGHKRAVLRLYRASKRIDDAFPDMPEYPGPEALPVCVIWGEADMYVPVCYAHHQKVLFPQAEVHVLPGLGHWPFIDDPQAVAQRLVDFLRRCH